TRPPPPATRAARPRSRRCRPRPPPGHPHPPPPLGRTRRPRRSHPPRRPQSASVNLSARRGPCRLGRGRPCRGEFRPGRESVLVTVVGRRTTLPGTRHHGG